jgi:RNA recognition motif-containing protein
MSVDPMTGRNPSYCFVDFTSRDLANRVMQEYDGRDFLRRALKVKLGVKSGAGRGRYDLPPRDGNDRPSPVFDRWKRLEEPEAISIAIQERRRVYVGGLPRFENQEDGQTQIRDLLKSAGIEPKVISKMISRHESLRDEEGNHNYCFVDLHSAKDAELAISSLNGLEKWGWNIKVNLSKSTTLGKGQSGRRLFVGGLPEFQGQEATDAAVREIFGGYEVESITKLYTPREEKKSEEGNHHFCFVELADGKQAESAIKELDRKESWGWQIRVKSGLSTGREQKPRTSGGASWGR